MLSVKIFERLQKWPRPIRRAVDAILNVFLRVMGQGNAIVVIKALREIDRLEAGSKFDEARTVRKHALATVHPSVTAPLWRSEGFDRLRLGDAAGALEAFEAGIAHLDDSAAVYGVAGPDRLYYGATVAAIKAGKIEVARHYYARLASLLGSISESLKRQQRDDWTREWDANLQWIQARLAKGTID